MISIEGEGSALLFVQSCSHDSSRNWAFPDETSENETVQIMKHNRYPQAYMIMKTDAGRGR